MQRSKELSEYEENIRSNKKRRRQLRLQLVKHVSNVRIRKYLKKNDQTWNNLSREKKVKKIINLSVSQPLLLSDCLRTSNPRDLISIHTKFICSYYNQYRFNISNFGRSWKKSDLIEELTSKFFQDTKIERKKRSIERRNLKGITLEDFKHPKLCGITIPPEIISLILPYLNKNLQTVVDIGGLSKSFYIPLLSSWESIIVDPENIFHFSLLAIRNVTHITVEVGRERTVFLRKELLYLVKENTNRIRSIYFNTLNEQTMKSFFSFIEYLHNHHKKKNSNPSSTTTKKPLQKIYLE